MDDATADLLATLRSERPVVQCLTNSVVQGFTANVLLALGAAPAMVEIPGEAGVMADAAGGVLINLGTLHGDQPTAMVEAAASAHASGTPWVLDPVGIGALPVRTHLATTLLAHQPTAIRGNASEILALAGSGAGARGVDSTDDADTAADAADELARRTNAIVAVSGASDLITDGERIVRVPGGDTLLTRVTGTGCSLGAVCAAFLAVTDERFATVTAAHTVFARAAEDAATRAAGPGTFAMHLLDALSHW